MTDKWKEDLRCPKCGKTGIASLSQPELAQMPIVEALPTGFRVVQTQYGFNFYCGACDIPAAP